MAKYEWSHTCDTPNDRGEQKRADFSIFRFDKKLFDLYKSSTVHTHKFRIPKKIIALFLFICAIVVFVIYMSSKGAYLGGQLAQKGAAKADRQSPAAAHASTSTPVAPYGYLSQVPNVVPVGGCISSATACRCYRKDMTPIDLDDAQCRALVRTPLPMTAKIGTDNKKG